MNTQNQVPNNQETPQDRNTLIESILRDYLPYWPVILVMAIMGYFVSKVYLNYQNPVYEVQAGILLKDESQSANNLIKQVALGKNASYIEDEMEVLKGMSVMRRAAKLGNAQTEVRSDGRIRMVTEDMEKLPFEVLHSNPDSVVDFESTFKVNANKTELVFVGNVHVPFNHWTKLGSNTIFVRNLVKPENKAWKKFFEKKYTFFLTFRSIDNAAKTVAAAMTMTKDKKLSVINLSVKSLSLSNGKRWLQAIVDSYQEETQDEKRKKAKYTMDFIDNRLSYVGQDLDSVESNLEQFKKSNNISRLSTEAELYLDKVKDEDKFAAQTELKLMVLDEVENYIQGKIKKSGMAPSLLGVEDPNISQYLQKLNAAETKYDLLLDQNGPNNDGVRALAHEIETYKESLQEIVRNTRKNLNVLRKKAENNFSKFAGEYDQLMRSIPSKERGLLNITRQQSIKNELYTFLLEKREESAIEMAGTLSDIRVIESTNTGMVVSPKRGAVTAGFTLGFMAIILGILFIRSGLNNKILSRSEIEARTSLPILAEIIESENESPLIMQNGIRTAIAEQLRALRTSLGYLNAEGGEAKTIMISSSLPGEGKSFIATNIALSMALSGKKTLLIESDMRKPGVAKYFKVSSRLGLSMHLVGKLNLEEILFATEFENLTIIPAGPIPPNPVELILNGRYEQMLKELGKTYDQIIIDCPPIGLVTDARVIGKWVDATVLIVRQQHTPRESVGMILESLNQQKVLRNVGLVFNGLKGGISGYGYGYSYANYGYGGYGYGYRYGGYSYGYGYYGNTKKKSTPLKFVYNVLIVPFFAFFAKNWMKRKN